MSRTGASDVTLLRAARRLVAAHGQAGLSLEALARATGCSRATVYRRTGGRAALLDALAAEGLEVGDRAPPRERILAAAAAVFGRVGFEAASVEAIAAEARVGPATVYRHFQDREGLVVAFLDRVGPRRGAREALAATTGDLRADLEALARHILASLRADETLLRLAFLEALRGGPLLQRVRAASPTRTLPVLVAVFERHLPRAEARLRARAFAGALLAFGVLGRVLDEPPPGRPEVVARTLATLFSSPPAPPRSRHGPRPRR